MEIIIQLMNEVVCVIPRMNPRHREYLSPRSTECDREVQRLACLLGRNLSVAHWASKNRKGLKANQYKWGRVYKVKLVVFVLLVIDSFS